MSCQRQILGICWYHFVSYASVISHTGQDSLCSRISSRRLAVFGHVRRLAEDVSAHTALSLAVKARSGRQPAHWRRSRGRFCHSWTTQIESDSGHCADLAWDMAGNRLRWRTLQPTADQADQWVSECAEWVNAVLYITQTLSPLQTQSYYLDKYCRRFYERTFCMYCDPLVTILARAASIPWRLLATVISLMFLCPGMSPTIVSFSRLEWRVMWPMYFSLWDLT